LEQIVNRLSPEYLEAFAAQHGIFLHYCFQLKLCDDARCWYCARFAATRLRNLDWFPIYTKPDGRGGWVGLAERQALLANPATRKEAMEIFLSDAALPVDVVKNAWTNSRLLDDARVHLLLQQTNLSASTIRELFTKLSTSEQRRRRGPSRANASTQT
jgi:hypothetical protein